MELREDGLFIPKEEIEMATMIIGGIGIAFLGIRLLRLALWLPVRV